MFVLLFALLVEQRTLDACLDEATTVSFVLNSLSRQPQIVVPELHGNKLVIYPRLYGITPEQWDKHFANKKTAKEWLRHALSPAVYRDILRVQTLDNIAVLTGKLHQEHTWFLIHSNVVRASRIVTRAVTDNGSYWTAVDHRSTERDTLLRLDKPDMTLHLGTLPNGLLFFAATDRNGKSLDYLPVDIAVDHITGKEVKVPLSCFACHTQGIKPFQFDAKKDDRFVDKDIQKYDAKKDDRFVDKDIQRYEKAVLSTGTTAKDVNKALRQLLEGR